jgi:hypothetical protein
MNNKMIFFKTKYGLWRRRPSRQKLKKMKKTLLLYSVDANEVGDEIVKLFTCNNEFDVCLIGFENDRQLLQNCIASNNNKNNHSLICINENTTIESITNEINRKYPTGKSYCTLVCRF